MLKDKIKENLLALEDPFESHSKFSFGWSQGISSALKVVETTEEDFVMFEDFVCPWNNWERCFKDKCPLYERIGWRDETGEHTVGTCHRGNEMAQMNKRPR